jgi:hypothetical protein
MHKIPVYMFLMQKITLCTVLYSQWSALPMNTLSYLLTLRPIHTHGSTMSIIINCCLGVCSYRIQQSYSYYPPLTVICPSLFCPPQLSCSSLTLIQMTGFHWKSGKMRFSGRKEFLCPTVKILLHFLPKVVLVGTMMRDSRIRVSLSEQGGPIESF